MISINLPKLQLHLKSINFFYYFNIMMYKFYHNQFFLIVQLFLINIMNFIIHHH